MLVTKRQQQGLSLIELMIGIVISLLVGLVAAGSAITFTAAQRQGMGIGGAGLNSGNALAALKSDAALAGLGFFGNGQYLCNTLSLSAGDTIVANGTAFTPILITTTTTNPATNNDRIDIVYGDNIEAGASVLLQGPSTGNQANTRSLLPAAVGNAVLLARADNNNCLVRTVTAVTPSTDIAPQRLTFDNTGLFNSTNIAFDTPPNFADQDNITMLGNLNWSTYSLNTDANTLELNRNGTATITLARNVIRLRAQYGIADAGSTTIKIWQDATDEFATLNADRLARVRALRIGIVTRSTQREKSVNNNCQAAANKPVLFGTEITPPVVGGVGWQCFRYRTSTIVVPLRNLVLGG